MTKRKIFLLILVFILYEVLVWLGSFALLPDSALLIGFVLTVCGLTVLAVYVLVVRLSSVSPPERPAAAAPEPKSSAPSSSPKPASSNAASELIQEANRQLARSPTLANQRVKSAISDFPLYLMLGTEGSGKTSLFLASEFTPELLAGQVHRDAAVVPTQLGNIWFADGAVVVEAAGGLFSGEISCWSDFLASFRRPGRQSRFARIFGGAAETALGGVLLCCDAATFVGVPDATRLAAIARLVQQRLRVVAEVFGRDFPVYVIFTKSDSIPYFGEFFGRLAETEDRQVLGWALQKGGALTEVKDAVTAGLNKLYLALAGKRLEFLGREKDTGKRPAVYEFPREFKRIRGPLVQFLADIFRTNPLQPNPNLVGVYFTGTRKVVGQATDLDRTMIHKVGDVTRILRAEDLQRLRSQIPDTREREPEITRWSFAADLWRQILERRPGNGAGVPVNQRQTLYRKLAFGTVAALCTAATLLFVNSFWNNHFLVTEVRAAAVQTQPVPPGVAPSLHNLEEVNALRSHVEDLVEGRPGFFTHFGFYEGGRLKDRVFRLYYARFREYFLEPVVHELEGQFSSLPSEHNASYPYDSVYAGLQTYSTITRSPNESSCKPDAALANRLLSIWRQDHPTESDGERIAAANFQFFADNLKADRIPGDLQISSSESDVQSGRSYLRTFRGVDPEYQRILEEVNKNVPSVRLADLTRNNGYQAVMRVQEEMAGAFSRTGWDRVQKLIDSASGSSATESCVLGSNGGQAAALIEGADLKAQIRQKYIDDYIQHWHDFLASVRVLPYNGCGDASAKLARLKDNNSPILAVLLFVTENTTFPKHPGSILQPGNAVGSARKGFRWPFGKSKESGLENASRALREAITAGPPEDAITAAFQPAHAVFQSPEPNKDHWTDDRNSPYLASLGELQRALEALEDRGGKCDETNQLANNDAKDKLAKSQEAVETLARNFDTGGAYTNVKALLEAPLHVLLPDPKGTLGAKISGAQQRLCSEFRALSTKYPFNPHGAAATIDQVDKVFDPKGSLLSSLREALGDTVAKSGDKWVPKPDAPVKLTGVFLEFFNHMSAISDALFQRPIKYRLSVQSNPAIKRVTGTVDGEPISMASKEYSWPPANPGINLRVEPASGGSSPLRSYDGIWSIFQLLGNAKHDPGTNQFRFVNVEGETGSIPQTILPDGSPIILEVTQFPNNVARAFDKGFFTVSCPPRALE